MNLTRPYQQMLAALGALRVPDGVQVVGIFRCPDGGTEINTQGLTPEQVLEVLDWARSAASPPPAPTPGTRLS